MAYPKQFWKTQDEDISLVTLAYNIYYSEVTECDFEHKTLRANLTSLDWDSWTRVDAHSVTTADTTDNTEEEI